MLNDMYRHRKMYNLAKYLKNAPLQFGSSLYLLTNIICKIVRHIQKYHEDSIFYLTTFMSTQLLLLVTLSCISNYGTIYTS